MKTLAAVTAILALSGPAAAFAQDRGALTVDFNTGQRGGRVMVALFDSATAYDGGRPVRTEMVEVRSLTATASFTDLPAGDYAFKAFHDVNGDGEMNFNPFGMPVEPYAFSNNAVGNMGPASWERARFRVDGPTAQTVEIR